MKKLCLLICSVMITIMFSVMVEARHHEHREPEPIPCWNCWGSGRCTACDGTGEIVVTHYY